jgi:hypothetical protein
MVANGLNLRRFPPRLLSPGLDDVNLGPGRICPNQRLFFPLWVCIEAPATVP